MTEHGKLLVEHDALSKVRFYIVFMFAGVFFQQFVTSSMMILVSTNDVQQFVILVLM